MLGVRRPSVSVAASILQRAGLIRYSRGRVEVVDRAGLESAACDYGVIAREYDRLMVPHHEDIVPTRAGEAVSQQPRRHRERQCRETFG